MKSGDMKSLVGYSWIISVQILLLHVVLGLGLVVKILSLGPWPQ